MQSRKKLCRKNTQSIDTAHRQGFGVTGRFQRAIGVQGVLKDRIWTWDFASLRQVRHP